jgi:hypothetical protein
MPSVAERLVKSLHGQSSRPDDPGIIMQLGGKNLQGLNGRCQRPLTHALVNPLDQLRQSFHYPSTQDKATGIESINQTHDPGNESLNHMVDEMQCQRVTCLCGLRYDFCGNRIQMPPGHFQQRSTRNWVGSDCFPRLLGDGPPTRQSFQATSIPTMAGRTLHINGDMAKLASRITAAGKQLPSTYYAAANARPNKETDEIIASLSGTIQPLA